MNLAWQVTVPVQTYQHPLVAKTGKGTQNLQMFLLEKIYCVSLLKSDLDVAEMLLPSDIIKHY